MFNQVAGIRMHRLNRSLPFQVPAAAKQVGLLGLEFLDQHRARLTGVAPRTMPVLMFEITRRCNLRCAYCGYPEHYPDLGSELTTEEIRAILRDCVTLKTRIVSFGGGEPFLRPDFIELIAYARSLGLQVHIDSNGTMVDAAAVDAIPDGADVAIIFSLDHPQADINDRVRGRGSHAGVTGAARLLRASRPRISVGINCVVGEHNVDRLTDMVDLASSLGIDGIKFLPLHQNLAHRWRYGASPDDNMACADPSGIPLDPCDSARVHRAIQDATRLARGRGMHTSSRRFVQMAGLFPDSLPPYQCWAGYMFGNIDPYGYLFPCYEIMDSNLNVRNGGLVAAWGSPAMAAMRARVRGCRQTCLSSGATEASLRMNPIEIIKDPGQLIADLRFFMGTGRR